MPEIVPAILRRTYEGIVTDWNKVVEDVHHIQIDVTDGVFAGDGTFREVRQFKKLSHSEKIELHMMVHTPSNFLADIIDLDPARCVFHVESFAGTGDIEFVYKKLRAETRAELGLALNPESPLNWIEPHLSVLDFVLFMGYRPGWAGQQIDPMVFVKIGQFKEQHPEILIAVDGNVTKETIPSYIKAGATILYANSSIFKLGDPRENIRQLSILAQAALTE